MTAFHSPDPIPPLDVLVVGPGPVGLLAASLLARLALRIGVIGIVRQGDTRSAAVLSGSVDILRQAGLGNAVFDAAESLRAIRIIDDTGGLLRSPETLFRAEETGRNEFGFNILNRDLTAALLERARSLNNVQLFAGINATTLDLEGPLARLTASDGRVFSARLVIAADGARSICRTAAGIATREWGYEQSALVGTFAHTRSHNNVSSEFHRAAGPLTTVPGPSNTSNLVWVERPAIAKRLSALDDAAFVSALEQRLKGVLGRLTSINGRAVFPLKGLTASSLVHRRVALAGEAAHVLPPIGAQGLNLGIRDAKALADAVLTAIEHGDDIGGDTTLQRYASARSTDVAMRTASVDLLNRSLLTGLVPAHLARGLGLMALARSPALRRTVMEAGLGPSPAPTVPTHSAALNRT